MALEADTHLLVPRCIVVRVVIANSDDGHSDIRISHTRSIPNSYVAARGCWVEKEGGPVAHPDPDMVDVGLQGGNPVADYVIGMIASEMVHVHISETVLGHILEPGTEIVDPETPVDCSK